MVGGKRSRKSPLMGNHQKCWLWGRHSVVELLRADRWHPIEIGLEPGLPVSILREVRSWAQRRNCPIEEWTAAEIEDRCRASDHQGLIARMPEFPYHSIEDLLKILPANAWCVLLDGIQDPFNYGAILRSAEVLGASAAFVGGGQQCGVTAQVVRSSAGAVLHLPLARGESVSDIARALQARGLQLCGATEKARHSPSDVDFRQPTCLVIGNEGRGISPELLTLCDQTVAIPQSGQVGSLNAAVAAGILCYEIGRQRR
jgi:23S rRNA (guanosine2251-2'-O)-methyltransferase